VSSSVSLEHCVSLLSFLGSSALGINQTCGIPILAVSLQDLIIIHEIAVT
jgi:hypothetical protein